MSNIEKNPQNIGLGLFWLHFSSLQHLFLSAAINKLVRTHYFNRQLQLKISANEELDDDMNNHT
jgi:hypothetical protein